MSWGWGISIICFQEVYCHDRWTERGGRRLNPGAMVWFRGRRAEVVECRGRKPCSVLGVLKGDGCRQVQENEPLQHLDGRAEEGDGAIGGA